MELAEINDDQDGSGHHVPQDATAKKPATVSTMKKQF